MEDKISSPCGCGRSPTGQCVGWHSLPKQEYRKRLAEHQEKQQEDNK